jgi:hypothetical protein
MSTHVRRLTGLALVLVLGSAMAVDAPAATVSRSVIGSGATDATSAGRRLQGTVGQTAVGSSAAATLAAAHGFWTFGVPRTTAVDPRGETLSPPGVIEFGPPSPNPSSGELAFTVGLPHAATASILVSDVRGRAVSPAASWALAAGRHRVVFDPARDATVPAGIYFARLVVDGRVEGVQRFVRMR